MTPVISRGWRLAALGLLVVLGVQSFRLRAAERRIGAVLLRADSLESANDTTRSMSERALSVLGDSLHGVERRAIQEKQRADALDRALGRERIARANIMATLDSMAVIILASGDTYSGVDSTRHLVFEVDTVPYSGFANVELPPRGTPSLDLRLSVAPLPLSLRLGCGDARNGIRPATVSLLGPRWATLSLDSLSQSPDLCRSPALQPQSHRWRWMGVGAVVVTVLSRLLR